MRSRRDTAKCQIPGVQDLEVSIRKGMKKSDHALNGWATSRSYTRRTGDGILQNLPCEPAKMDG